MKDDKKFCFLITPDIEGKQFVVRIGKVDKIYPDGLHEVTNTFGTQKGAAEFLAEFVYALENGEVAGVELPHSRQSER